MRPLENFALCYELIVSLALCKSCCSYTDFYGVTIICSVLETICAARTMIALPASPDSAADIVSSLLSRLDHENSRGSALRVKNY